MSKFLETLEKVKESLPEGSEEVVGTLKSEYEDIMNKMSSLRDEAKSNREKSEALESKVGEITTYKSKVDELTQQTTELQEKLTDTESKFNEYREKVFGEKKETFISRFNEVKNHPEFSNVKDLFNGKVDEDGNWNFDEVESDAMSNNISELAKLDKIKYFKVKSAPTDGGRHNDVSGNEKPSIKNRGDLRNYIDKLIDENV